MAASFFLTFNFSSINLFFVPAGRPGGKARGNPAWRNYTHRRAEPACAWHESTWWAPKDPSSASSSRGSESRRLLQPAAAPRPRLLPPGAGRGLLLEAPKAPGERTKSCPSLPNKCAVRDTSDLPHGSVLVDDTGTPAEGNLPSPGVQLVTSLAVRRLGPGSPLSGSTGAPSPVS